MSDIKDIFGIGIPPNKPKTVSLPQRKEKLKWSREARSLVKSAHGTSSVATMPIKYKSRKSTPAVSWKWEKISSSARDTTENPANDVVLHHWVKFHNLADYRFTKFNKKIKLLEYTNDEYDGCCTDPTWSREDTDRLMELCKKYDLRFVIIEDRFNPLENKQNEYKGSWVGSPGSNRYRSIEELKESFDEVFPTNYDIIRFYHIQKALMKHRKIPGFERHALFTSSFDINLEKARKHQLLKLFKRSREFEQEMAELVLENHKNDMLIRKIKKDQKDIRKKQKLQRQASFKSGGNFIIKSPTRSVIKDKDNRQKIRVKPLITSDLPTEIVPSSMFRPRPSRVYLRSHQPMFALNINENISSILENDLKNLNIYNDKTLTCPTGNICKLYDQLRSGIVLRHNLENLLISEKKIRSDLELQVVGQPVDIPAKRIQMPIQIIKKPRS